MAILLTYCCGLRSGETRKLRIPAPPGCRGYLFQISARGAGDAGRALVAERDCAIGVADDELLFDNMIHAGPPPRIHNSGRPAFSGASPEVITPTVSNSYSVTTGVRSKTTNTTSTISTMKKIIEFQQHTPGELELISPLQASPHAQFRDLILKPDYAGLKYTLPMGTSTFRILPAIKGSPQWMAAIHALSHANGRHSHPKTTQASATSVFDAAQAWLKHHEPEMLYSKSSPGGHRFWTSPLAVCWILVDGPGQPKLRILLASAFAGSRQGTRSGLGHQILELVTQNSQLLDADEGYQIRVTRAYSAGSKFPETQLTVNPTATSLNECLGELSSDDLRLVCPIENTIRQIDTECEWALLAATIGQDATAKIRAAATAP